jgi:hypothetical protein
MPALFFTCPNTQGRAPTGIQTDVKSLRESWSKKLTVNCSLCGQVHELSLRETYTYAIMADAIEVFRRA